MRHPCSISTVRAWILLVVCWFSVAVTSVRPARAQSVPIVPPMGSPFSDDFELNWAANQQYGSVGLSTDTSHSGLLSLKLTSTGGGQRDVWLRHQFPQSTLGTLSVWFYDTAPGSQTLYSGLYAADSTDPAMTFSVHVADWAPSTYVWSGPGMGETPTTVARALGWHQFTLRVTAAGFNAFIDQTLVGSIAGSFTFDTVRLVLSGPVWRPNATYYFDQFSFIPAALPPPDPATAGRPTASALPIRTPR